MQKNNVITLTLNQADQDRLFHAWSDTASKAPQYARYQLRPENCVITCYTSGKVVFQGTDAEVYAAPFMSSPAPSPTVSAAKSSGNAARLPQAGSDEVGTGDYFGPVCVCASIVTEETYPLLVQYGARDSKALKDTDIRKIAGELIERIPHSLLIVEPFKYNQVHASANMNAIKAMCHNQAYINLRKRYALPEFCVIDQFAEEPVYYHYLKNTRDVLRGIHFETKAEDKYISVGISSVFSRYAFLKYMDEMEKKYDMQFQKGGGTKADECAAAFVRRYGKEQLPAVAKMHFKNTERVLKILED